MNAQQIEAVGAALFQATLNHQKIEAPVITYPDMCAGEAYAIQRVMVRAYERQGYHISGKKIGLTSAAMRKLAGIHEPDYGCLFHELRFDNGSKVQIDTFLEPSIEAELAFCLREDLTGGDITPEEVLDKTAYVTAALEIVDMRQDFRGKSVMNSIADNACFGGYVLGDVALLPRAADLGLLGMVFYKNGDPIDSACGAAVMDHPAIAAAWLANKMVELGEPLRAGDLLLTGSFIQAIPVERGDTIRALFAHVGEVELSFI